MLNSLRGSLRIKITGAATERFLNLCAARGIAFWDMKKTDIDTVYASVRIEGFFAMHKYAGRCMCKIAVDKKRGMPFALRKYGRRYALWGGVLLCTAFILAMSRLVWTIEINGCEKTNQF
ncbi:MAG: sporulation protein YqfD, partial [Angelakisella sp.]